MLPRAEHRHGVVLVLVAVSLVAILGIVAMALDAGLLFSQRRGLQAAADAAALAAAIDLFKNPSDRATAVSDAQSVALSNYPDMPSPVVNIPPAAGNYANQLDGPACAEVLVQYKPQPYFSAIFGLGNTSPLTVRAVARGPYNRAVVLLDPDATSMPNVSTNGGIVVASVIDPLLYLTEPDPSSLPLRRAPLASKKPVTLEPGRYLGGLNLTGQGKVTMNSGIYFMEGGGFSYTGQGNLVANGILLYSQGGIDISPRQAVVSPLTTGPYRGISIFQDRNSSASVSLVGNGLANITGTIYAASSVLSVNETSNGDNLGTQYICYDLDVTGNTVTVNYSPGSNGRTRALGLVE